MNIPYIFLVCSFIVELCSAQTISINVMENYLLNVQNKVWEKVRAYGFSNLPDDDIDFYYNITDGQSYDIKGTLYLEDGFVMDMEKIVLIHMGKTRSVIGKGVAWIETFIGFEGLMFFRDFRFEADEPEKILDQAVGGVIIKPEKFYFDMQIMHDLIKDTVNCTMSKMFQGKAYKQSMNFYPKNTLTARLRKSFKSTLFPKIGDSWQPIFEPLLNEVVKTIPFPTIEFSVTRS